MRTVHKYPLEFKSYQTLDIKSNHNPRCLYAGVKDGQLWLWVLVADPDEGIDFRETFAVLATGQQYEHDDAEMDFISSVIIPNPDREDYIFHVFHIA